METFNLYYHVLLLPWQWKYAIWLPSIGLNESTDKIHAFRTTLYWINHSSSTVSFCNNIDDKITFRHSIATCIVLITRMILWFGMESMAMNKSTINIRVFIVTKILFCYDNYWNGMNITKHNSLHCNHIICSGMVFYSNHVLYWIVC